MCTKAPATVDYETNHRGNYLYDLEACLKRFNGALTLTMNSYRDLLTAFDHMAQVFGNLAGDLRPEVKDPIIAMRDGMRDLKDKGPFVVFNSDVHEGTITVLDPLRQNLKKAQASLDDLKTKQKDYDSLRAKVEKREKEYAKKDKPLSNSDSYKKDVAKRDKSKAAYESKRDNFEGEVSRLKSLTERVLLDSMNNYLQCTATFSGYLETTMNSYRTDLTPEGEFATGKRKIKLSQAKAEAERRSTSRRLQTAANLHKEHTSENTTSMTFNSTHPETTPASGGEAAKPDDADARRVSGRAAWSDEAKQHTGNMPVTDQIADSNPNPFAGR